MESLADFLGVPRPAGEPSEPGPRLEDITDSKAFAAAVLESREFRSYIVNGLALGTIPSAVIIRVMDLAGWQKPAERVEHSGRVDSVITEVRRVVIRVGDAEVDDDETVDAPLVTRH